MAARRTHIPFVTTYHGLYNSNGRLKRLYNSSCYAATGPSPIPNGRPGHIRNTYGASVKRLIVIPRGIDLTTRPTSRWIAGHARANIGALPKGSAWFCCLGASPAGRASSRSWRRSNSSSEAAAGLKECAPSWLAMRKVVTITSRNSWGAINGSELNRIALLSEPVGDTAAAYRASDSPDPEAFGRVPPEALYRELIGTPA
jgi:hypothetical protein